MHVIHALFVLGGNFRIIQEPDSDEDPTTDSSPASQHANQVTKVNGTHTTVVPVYSSVDDDQPSERNSRRKRNHSLTTTNFHFPHYSSHSSSRLSNSSSDDDTSSDDNSFYSIHKRQKQMENNQSHVERTPSPAQEPKNSELGTPDSGIVSTPGNTTPR